MTVTKVIAAAAIVLCASACTGRVEPSDKAPTLSPGPAGTALERAPECNQAGDLCDRMIDELNSVRNAVPNAQYSGAGRLTLSGDGRFILTATLVDTGNDLASVRNKVEAILRLQGWTQDTAGGRAVWRGDEEMTGWLFTFDVAAQGSGSKLNVALYAPK